MVVEREVLYVVEMKSCQNDEYLRDERAAVISAGWAVPGLGVKTTLGWNRLEVLIR